MAVDKNRVIRVLEDCNVKLSSVLSNTQGIVVTKLINKLCEGKIITMFDINQVYHRKLAANKEDLFEACQGMLTGHHIYLLGTIRKDILSTESVIGSLDARIKEMLSPYGHVQEKLKAIPGLNTKTIEDLVVEIGLDMSAFPSEKHLASWAGMCPGNNENASKKRAGALTMATSG